MEILAAGAPAARTLEKIRADREQCEAQIEAIAGGGLSVDDATAHFLGSLGPARARVEQYMAGFGRPGSIPDPLAAADKTAFDFWLDPVGFERQLRARFKAALPPPGLPVAERPHAIAVLKAKLLELGKAEEAKICALEGAGLFPARRRDVDLELVLQSWDQVPA